MQDINKNKIVGGVNDKAQNSLQDFFFSGGTEYLPMTVQSGSREEAEKEWEKNRTPVIAQEAKKEE
jgi:hypothetical protein